MTPSYQTQKILTVKIITFALIVLTSTLSFGYTVKDLKATYSNGQVFLTWTNPAQSNLQYNVYRSTSKFNDSDQLKASKRMGFVRDNSAQNIHLSQIEKKDVYFKIKDSDEPLSANQGLYVITCTDNKSYYYAVTVTDLNTDVESKQINLGENSLKTAISETVVKPQPVWQDDANSSSNEVMHRYVQFVNNQETELYPAMNSTGSYGFNFFLVKRGNASTYPLFICYQGGVSAGVGSVGLDEQFTDCYILGIYDWLPVPNEKGKIGDNTYYCCYHEDFNIYTDDNPIPTDGYIRTYPQKRYNESMEWIKDHYPIDDSRVYLKGTSANGFGALLTAIMFPEKIAAVYANVEPISIGANNETYKQMWGLGSSKLPTDILDIQTLEPLAFTKFTDFRKMVDIMEDVDLPLIFDIHGKNDHSVAWSSGKIEWFDSLERNHVGGVFYWDQREHNGDNKDFLSEETTPDFYRYQTNKSFPAFSNCTINQDPGKGTKTSGDPYGAINGYLDWEDDITDEECLYEINVFVKNLYVGGKLDPQQYSTCNADITFRRLQEFKPKSGETIKWKNYDNSNSKIDEGTFEYKGGLITLKGIKINKSGNRIELKITNCERLAENESAVVSSPVSFTKSPNGYMAHVESANNEDLFVQVYDLMGRLVQQQKVSLVNGDNTFEIRSPGRGIFLVEMKSAGIAFTEKLFF